MSIKAYRYLTKYAAEQWLCCSLKSLFQNMFLTPQWALLPLKKIVKCPRFLAFCASILESVYTWIFWPLVNFLSITFYGVMVFALPHCSFQQFYYTNRIPFCFSLGWFGGFSILHVSAHLLHTCYIQPECQGAITVTFLFLSGTALIIVFQLKPEPGWVKFL